MRNLIRYFLILFACIAFTTRGTYGAEAHRPAGLLDHLSGQSDTCCASSIEEITCAVEPDCGCAVDCGCDCASACGEGICCSTACQPGDGCPVGNCCRRCGGPDAFCETLRCGNFCDTYCHSSCDMPQHMAYHPESHGYYYLKPYNYQHLPVHQEFVASFGGDRRNPYDTRLLDDLGGEFEGDAFLETTPNSWQPSSSEATNDNQSGRSDTSNPFSDNGERYEELVPGEPIDADGPQ